MFWAAFLFNVAQKSRARSAEFRSCRIKFEASRSEGLVELRHRQSGSLRCPASYLNIKSSPNFGMPFLRKRSILAQTPRQRIKVRHVEVWKSEIAVVEAFQYDDEGVLEHFYMV